MIWEDIDGYHKRAKVYGGWLVKCFEEVFHPAAQSIGFDSCFGHDFRFTTTFIPDPEHFWKLETEVKNGIL